MIKNNKLEPLIKWTGGKSSELVKIHPEVPNKFNNYFEPFIGGGAVYFSIETKNYFINDKSEELINLYKIIKEQNDLFFNIIYKIDKNWKSIENFIDNNKKELYKTYNNFIKNIINKKELKTIIENFIDNNKKYFLNLFSIKEISNEKENFIKELKKTLFNKIIRMKILEEKKGSITKKEVLENIEGAIKASFYMQIRFLYNNIKEFNLKKEASSVLYFFIRNFAYSGMFRYNKEGKFNVPYGGIGYNRKNILKKLEYYKSKNFLNHIEKTNIFNLDFEDFFKLNKPQENDFIFLDPPYDSPFSAYDNNTFNREDQERLAKYLINECKAKWMIVISNTDFIYNLYNKKGINISSFDKKYLVNFHNRVDGNVKHLIIKNYS